MIRSEVDGAGRIVRAFIGSYELVRSHNGWSHVDRVCPAWMNKIGCYHREALEQLDREAR